MARALKRLPRLKGKRKRLPVLERVPTPLPEAIEEAELDVWAKRLGSEAEAKRMLALKRQYPQGTLPELVTLDWLQSNGYQFQYQVPLFGGRRAGGTVLDFLVIVGSEGLAWSVAGEYWHTLKNVSLRDKRLFERLIGAEAAGFRINRAVTLWENDIYERRPLIFYQALAGVNFRPL